MTDEILYNGSWKYKMSEALKRKPTENFSLLINPSEYFNEMVNDAFVSRKIRTDFEVKNYIVRLLEFYLSAENLFEKEQYDETGKKKPQTLAEIYLTAVNSELNLKIDLLKKLGDRALYISGFFADSFNRKLVDVDYYVNMGGNAYYQLSSSLENKDPLKRVYSQFSKNFSDYVQVLTHISQKSMVSNNQSLLKLYDNYLRTGSEVAKEKLLEMGIVTQSDASKKSITKN